MKLIGYFRSSAAFRVRIALNLKGIAVEHAFRHLRKGEQRLPDYVAINPQKLVPALESALESWDARISTGRLNTFFKEIVAATPPPVRGGKQPKILFATQATARPPTFVLFTSGFLEAGYRRFLERKLRETFGFEGSPIRINVRVREKRGAKPRK